MATTAVLALGLLAAPAPAALDALTGTEALYAQPTCRAEVCGEVDLKFWRTKVCFEITWEC